MQIVTRGPIVAALLPFLSVVMQPSAARAQQGDARESPTAADVVAAYLEAIGGAEANAALQTRRSVGTVTLASVGVPWWLTTIQKAPDRSLSRVEVPGYGVVAEGCDGTVAWKSEPGQGVRELAGAELDAKLRDARFDGLTELLTGGRVSYARQDELDGRAVHVLDVTWPDSPWAGADYEVALDAETHRIRRLEILPAGGAGGIRTTLDMSDYRAVDGVQIPFEIVVSMGPTPVMAIQLDSVTHGVEVDDALFAMPKTDLAAIDYTPVPGRDWEVSTPAEQGLDPDLVAELYLDAADLPTLYGLLVVKNGRLIGEGYFNEGGIDQLSGRQSVTKSYTSALVGKALELGCLSSVDQRMMELFPELEGRIDDPRKERITIRQLLEMRAGYPWEDMEPPWFDRLFLSDDWHWVPHVADFPLTSDPGAEYKYSNLTSHILAVIVSRACDTDLASLGQEHVFSPIGAELGGWSRDADGYNFGAMEIYFTARDMAKFGRLYLQGGRFDGEQVLPAEWVEASLRAYTERARDDQLTRYFRGIGYGYQWWSARAGEHHVDFAWGHGGNLIVLIPDLDMIVVTTADPLHHLPGKKGWQTEVGILDLVGRFVASLPGS
jgi:CubicO group peptidase (beta-lactamase class C family)